MFRPLRSEVHRMTRRWMTRILIASMAVFGIAFYELIYFSVKAQLQLLRSGNAPANATGPQGTQATIAQLEQTLTQLTPAHVSELGVGLVAGLGAVMLIVFAASHIGTEFGWGTLRTLMANGLSRRAFLTTKLASLAGFALLFTVVGVAAAVAGSYIVSLQAGYDTTGLDALKIASAAWRTAFGFAPYIALASLIAVWSRSSGAGIAAGLVIYFAESIVMGLLISFNRDYATVANLGISRNVQSLSRASLAVAGTDAASAASTLPDQTQAALVLAAWTAIFVAVAYWRLRTRDVTLA